MAEVFCDYARYYDLLYRDKDYPGEAAYIDTLIKAALPGAATILNLGCGTGKHDACLEKLGYSIVGVDLSETMLAEAQKRAVAGRLEFMQGDARTVVVNRTFDVVISLFHVMSYQTTDVDVSAVLKTAADHLAPGGLLLFDFWHAGGVEKDPPELRVKRLEDDAVKIVRIAEPVIDTDRRVIDVHYQMIAMQKGSDRCIEMIEHHAMRYFRRDELEAAVRVAGFEPLFCRKWWSDEALTDAWYGVLGARRL